MKLVMVIALLAAACGGSKKAPSAAPSPAADPTAPGGGASESDLRDEATPDDPDDLPAKTSADPCDGGE